jgi:hypothetical protein
VERDNLEEIVKKLKKEYDYLAYQCRFQEEYLLSDMDSSYEKNATIQACKDENTRMQETIRQRERTLESILTLESEEASKRIDDCLTEIVDLTDTNTIICIEVGQLKDMKTPAFEELGRMMKTRQVSQKVMSWHLKLLRN